MWSVTAFLIIIILFVYNTWHNLFSEGILCVCHLFIVSAPYVSVPQMTHLDIVKSAHVCGHCLIMSSLCSVTPSERASPSSGPATRGTSPSVASPSSLRCGSATPDDITKPPTPLNLQDPTMFALKKCSTHVSPSRMLFPLIISIIILFLIRCCLKE